MKLDSSYFDYAQPARGYFQLHWSHAISLMFAAGIAATLTWSVPVDLGRGGYHPYRVLGCFVTVMCLIGYGLVRVWNDSDEGEFRATVFSFSLIASVVMFCCAHFCFYGLNENQWPRRMHIYWAFMRWLAYTIVATALFEAAHWSVMRAGYLSKKSSKGGGNPKPE